MRGSDDVFHYALVPRSSEVPQIDEAALIIRTPVKRMVPMETVTIGYLAELGLLDSIIAAASVEFISNPEVTKRVASGDVASLQSGQGLDVEKMLLLQPDIIITSVLGDSNFDVPPKLVRSGLPVVLSAGYMEQHPLARAEWIKFVAAFYEMDARADEVFDAVEANYKRLKGLSAEVSEKPTILCGAPYSGVWHVPGGQSYTARMIKDAGGDYLWSEDTTQGGVPLDTERVFLKAALADLWINPSHHRSMTALLSIDHRFGKFAPAKNRKVYNNTKQVTPSGGNAIWETGVTRPDHVLADLLHIFHPDLLEDHDLIYYQHLK